VVFSSLALGTGLWGLTGAGVGSIVSIWIMALLHIVMARKVWRLDMPVRSPIIRAIAVFAAGWLIIAVLRPADNLMYCLMACAAGLAAIIFGGLADALRPNRIQEVFK
jgi:O-antigen/teichoic acid export membrane protein